MAQELVVVLSCDVCGSREGVVSYAIGGRAVDLCDPDANTVPVGFADLVSLFDKHSRDVDVASSSSPPRRFNTSRQDSGGDYDLPELYRTCPSCRFVSRTRTAISQHVKSKHAAQLVAAERSAGRRFVCTCGDEAASFASLGLHVKRAPGGRHGFAG
jgi:hypothetical protein